MAFTVSVAQLTIELETGTSNLTLEDATTDLLTETAGAATDLTAYLKHGSPTLKFNTLDMAFVNPPSGALELAAAVTTTDPFWSGTIAAITTADPVDRQGNAFVLVAATNTNALPNDTAPFDLSDAPAQGLFDYLLEDGSGHYLLETGTDFQPGALLLEGSLSYGYRNLSVRQQLNSDGSSTTLGQCMVIQPGLRPGNTVHLTSQNQGYSAYPFQINQATITWPVDSANPFYLVEFGDVPQTLAVWTQVTAPAPATIVTPQATVPSGPVTYGSITAGHRLWTQGGGIVTIASSTFSVSAAAGSSLTAQVLGAIDCRARNWDNYVATPRRAVRATLSGGVFTGGWQETPPGTATTQGARAVYDLSSAPGLALAAGTYTLSIQIDTTEFNQLEVFSAWANCSVTTT